tara:strand:- start:871 stop:1062 length:192 start_codon:yes stop_codon:yes gene_type:complete
VGLKISLQSKLDEIPPENEWWKSETQRKYYEAADKLIDLGMDPGDAIDLLSDLYWAAAAEFGN